MLEDLILTIEQYLPDADLQPVVKAYQFGSTAHEGQFRKSGEKYFVHPVEVTKILAELKIDTDTLVAGLLHDVVEDTPVTLETIESHFGSDVAMLVDGVTKLGKLDYKTKEETQAESLRKMFVAMAKDIRVILIKLADRLHNLRTLKYMPEAKAKSIAQESLEIYAPVADRLGIFRIKWEMEDLALRYIDPEGYFDLVEKVSGKRTERLKEIDTIIVILQNKLKEANIKAQISGRAKHFYSIYSKMHYRNKSFDEIYDLIAIRILVDTVQDCYGVIGIIHTLWKPLPGRFKDYIAMPKPNRYQSLHTTLIGPGGNPLEIQIRTHEMHKVAEFGIAAHWKYKENVKGMNPNNLSDQVSWVRQMVELQKDIEDPQEFMESLKIDLFDNQVYVFTPKGNVIELPAGSVPLDLAYKIHTEIGNKYTGAKVDGKIVPLNYELKNGNIVEILTSSASKGPSLDWLNVVKSSHSKNKIRQWFKKEHREENIEKGKEMLDREVKRQGYTLSDFLKQKYLQPIAKQIAKGTIEDLYAMIGFGAASPKHVFLKVKDKYLLDHPESVVDEEEIDQDLVKPSKRHSTKANSKGVSVKGIDNVLIRLAKCCNPLPGDPIVGYITKGRGITVHRADCSNIKHQMGQFKDKQLEVVWDDTSQKTNHFSVEIHLEGNDRKGLFVDVSKVLTDEKISVNAINARKDKQGMAIMSIMVEVESKKQLESIQQKLRQIDQVYEVYRG